MKIIRRATLAVALASTFFLFGCKKSNKPTDTKPTDTNTSQKDTSDTKKDKANDKDIVIIGTSDVHCAVDDIYGYASISTKKKELQEENYVSLVDSGDFMQGGLIGNFSKGKYIIDIMNYVGYDAVALGNHDFDYGMDELKNRIDEFNGDTLSCNVSYTGTNTNKLSKVKPYSLKRYGQFTIGYVGISTPETPVSSTPSIFKENGEYVYSFAGETATTFYNCIQQNINECKSAGADYVILLSHTGTNDENIPFTTYDILNNTTGYVAIFDGHAHKVMPWEVVKDKDNNDVYLAEAGYRGECFATLTIAKNGQITTNYYEYVTTSIAKDEDTTTYINGLKDEMGEEAKKVVATIDITLDYSKNMVRSRETQIGNLIADSYREATGAQIAFINGGAIRTKLEAGDVTYAQIREIQPFSNFVMSKYATGQQIIDYLEFVNRNNSDDPNTGTLGAFAQVSGIKFDVDVTIPSPVIIDETTWDLIDIVGTRRVKNVKVLEDGVYVDIDLEKEYLVASNNYILDAGGDGINMFKDNPIVMQPGELDFEIVLNYIVNVLHGQLADDYTTTQGRITIITE